MRLLRAHAAGQSADRTRVHTGSLYLRSLRIVGCPPIDRFPRDTSGPAPRGAVGARVRAEQAPTCHHGDPVLHSADLDRTTGYYQALGLEVVQRHDTYLVMQAGPVELHFTTSQDTPAPGQAFLHVPDAGRLWKQLQQRSPTGIGPVEDQASGLREFVVTDPDGNHIRVGSPAPKD